MHAVSVDHIEPVQFLAKDIRTAAGRLLTETSRPATSIKMLASGSTPTMVGSGSRPSIGN